MTLLPEVRQELIATAARRATTGGRRRAAPGWLPRIELGRVAVLAGVGCALAVAAVALIALRQQPSKGGGSAPGSGGLSALEAKLAILRRPQTPADRQMARYLRPRWREGVGYVPGLTRLAATVKAPNVGRMSVVMFVERCPDLGISLRHPAPTSCNQRPAVITVVVAKGREANGTGPRTAAEIVQPGNVVSGLNLSDLGLNTDVGISVGIVPDGVARVKWTFSGAGFGILHPHSVTVYAHVHNNVAIASVIPGEGPLAQATWYSASGKSIASGRGGLGAAQQLQQIRAVNASRNVPIAPSILAHYSLFHVVAPDDPARDPAFATEVAGAGSGAGQLNYLEARYIPSVTGLDGRGLWVIPGPNGICITDPQAGTCGPLRAADAIGIVGTGGYNGSEQTLSGLVPDGNRTVTFVLGSGARVTAPVVDYNAYEVTVHGRIVAIIDRDTEGKLVEHPLVGDHPPWAVVPVSTP